MSPSLRRYLAIAMQGAMIALMSCLGPTFVARRQVRSGTILPRAGRVWRPHHAFARAAIVAVVVAAVVGMARAALMLIGPGDARSRGHWGSRCCTARGWAL